MVGCRDTPKLMIETPGILTCGSTLLFQDKTVLFSLRGPGPGMNIMQFVFVKGKEKIPGTFILTNLYTSWLKQNIYKG